jgi:hypothetical protein
VTPPDYVLAQLGEQREHAACEADLGSCSAGQNCCETETVAPPERAERGSSVVLLRALGCQGVGMNWLAAAIAVPLVQVDLSLSSPAMAWIAIQPPVSYLTISASPPVPPPRRAIA